MPKPAKKRSSPAASAVPAATPTQPAAGEPKAKKSEAGSKQGRVIAMLRSPAGATIAAMMKTTGWQQHSVRGFLAGVVRKRLKLKLGSSKVDGNQVYRITSADGGKFASRQPKRRSA
ncbi:MAG TPA: DUF3489 domain-containing protein [Steroidobacteraceae bacterium]|jgi:hypothetical protein|nr:DUF3489 domain-containing protein [Steroidobacteraceae bacterium]